MLACIDFLLQYVNVITLLMLLHLFGGAKGWSREQNVESVVCLDLVLGAFIAEDPPGLRAQWAQAEPPSVSNNLKWPSTSHFHLAK